MTGNTAVYVYGKSPESSGQLNTPRRCIGLSPLEPFIYVPKGCKHLRPFFIFFLERICLHSRAVFLPSQEGTGAAALLLSKL